MMIIGKMRPQKGLHATCLPWALVHKRMAKADNKYGHLNLAGLIIGNPWTDAATDNFG